MKIKIGTISFNDIITKNEIENILNLLPTNYELIRCGNKFHKDKYNYEIIREETPEESVMPQNLL